MSPPVYVIFQLDTEDFITPETDDVLLDLAKIFNKHGVKGSFAIVGEKARALARRGRSDVIELLKTQDVAYQSNYHSVHPTIAEYLKDKGWEEGVHEVLERESSGVRDLERIFGMKPSAFIQPGGCWAPQVPYAMRKLGIRVYADGIFLDQPVWFCGILAVRYAIGYRERESGNPEHLRWIKEEFEKHYERLRDKGGLIIVVLHPCMLRTKEFWDAVNFARGKSPKELTPAPLISEEEYKRKLQEFDEFVGYVSQHPGVRVITFRDLPDLIEETPSSIPIELGFQLAEKASKRLSYYELGDVILSAAEAFGVIVSIVSYYEKKGAFPSLIPVRFLLGPLSPPHKMTSSVEVSTDALLKVCGRLNQELNLKGAIPSSVEIEGYEVGPAALMKTLAKLTLMLREKPHLPQRMKIEPSEELPEIPEVDLETRVRRQWGWIIFPEGFSSEKIVELTLLQSWTWKPARFKRS